MKSDIYFGVVLSILFGLGIIGLIYVFNFTSKIIFIN